MEEVPSDLLAALPEGAGPVVARWWATLSEVDRCCVAGLWDERLEVCFFSPQSDTVGGTDTWEQVPIVAGGRFVPHDDDGRDEWEPGYFEHLIQHPELVLAYEAPRRTFHIVCTLHAAARACVAAGRVPIEFTCPVGSATCPLLPLRGASLTRRCAGSR